MILSLQKAIAHCTLLAVTAALQTIYIPFQAPSYPLAVRNPYLNAWIPGNQVDNLASSRAQFWTGAPLTWSVLARIDGATYNLFGVETSESNTISCTVVSAEYTATRTMFVVDAGDAQFRLEFLSPVNPKDYVRQSTPFSYLTVSVIGVLNGKPASVQIYSDIDDSWNGQDLTLFDQTSSWTLATQGGAAVWQINHVGATQYAQGGPNGDMALWGSVVYASQPSGSAKFSTAAGQLTKLRSYFALNGDLSSLGPNPDWSKGGVTAFAHDLGTVGSQQSVTFALGFTRDCDLEYLGDCRVGYYKSKYNDTVSAAVAFLNDYATAEKQSGDMDSTIKSKAVAAAGQNYADIVVLSTRQTFGAIDLTIPETSLDTNDAMAFMKEISSDGNVNTMDVIYPAFPQLYVMDVEYIRLLLEPVVRYLASGKWHQPYVIHDIGGSYPKADGHNDQNAEAQPIEETGNLLILAWIYTNSSGNTSWASQYSSLFKGYAEYLVTNGLHPSKQLSTDDAAGAAANQTNLAIKAAVGLTSFGALTNQQNYTAAGQSFAKSLYNDGLGTDKGKTHFTLEYDDETSWTTTFNLFPDYLMKLNTFDAAAFAMQSSWYPQVRSKSGVALDSKLPWAKTDWMLWAGATSSPSTMGMFVDDLHSYLADTRNNVPFSDRYYTSGGNVGKSYDYKARPVVGGEWSAMALGGTF